jgi:poly(hydroxyalkanoate) granule-associated protein
MATRKKAAPKPGFNESAKDLWLAGVGAVNIVGEEGSRVFSELVEKGKEWQEANEGGRISRITERAQGFKEDARGVLSKVITPIEDGLSATMARLGVPTRAEIVQLTHRVEELTRIVQQTRHAAKAKAAAPPKAKAKPAPKPKPRAKAAGKAKPKAEPAVTS